MTEVMMTRRGGGGKSTAIDISSAEVTLDFEQVTFDGSKHKPVIQSVMLAGQLLIENQDYVCIGEEKSDAGDHTLQIIGILKYDGVVEKKWHITKAAGSVSLSNDTLTVKGVMGTVDSSVTVTKPELCKITAESLNPEFATAQIIDGNKVQVTSVKAGQAQVVVKTSDTNFTEVQTTLTVIVEKADGSISVQPSEITIQGEAGTSDTATLTVTGDGEVSINTSAYVQANREGNRLTVTSVSEGSDTLTITLAETENYTGATCSLEVNVVFKKKAIYGVEWDGSSSTALSRTDDAALLGDPTPALNGAGGSSPFDNLEPWSKMQRSTQNGSVMVSIPKFWFKFTDNGSGKFKLQISTYEQAGFHVSPAHADRKDGKGERDVVYVGRYHCASDWKSKTGESPKVSQTRAQFRTGVKTLGTGWYMMDWPMWATIQMLYLVEFADFDAQKVIGYGCGNNSKVEAMGYTDSMSYHTGTTKSARTEYGVSTQYRWIEGLWDNCFDWIDGITFSSLNAYASMDVKNYSDSTSGYTNVGKFPSSTGYIKYMGIPTATGFEWAWYPKESGGSKGSYVSDYSGVGSSYVVCFVGGVYIQDQGHGLFYYSGNSVSHSYSYFGSRPIYLP